MATTEEHVGTRDGSPAVLVSDESSSPPRKDSTTARAVAPLSPSRSIRAQAPSSVSPPRLKKKVPWKGKNIMVLLPMDVDRGKRNKAPAPMSEHDVDAMLSEWGQLGYDTSGFNLGYTSDEITCLGQSRGVWPTKADSNYERAQGAFRVSIPDRKHWEAYVQEVKEAKLRALGVTLGDEEPASRISPAVSIVSRHTPTQYPPLPFSPPIPTSSAASSHINVINPFSPQILPGAGLSASQSSNPGSIPSPASVHSHLQGKHNPRQSIVLPGDHSFGSPSQYAQGQNPGFWSPHHTFQYQALSRGASPSLHNLGLAISPLSPFHDGQLPTQSDALAQSQQGQKRVQGHLQMQSNARASPTSQEVGGTDDERTEKAASKSPSKTPEFARTLQSTSSVGMKREFDEAEYHLEKQMQRQLEHVDYSPHPEKPGDNNPIEAATKQIDNRSLPPDFKGLAASRYANDSDSPILHHPQPHTRGHSLSQRSFQEENSGRNATRPTIAVPNRNERVNDSATDRSEMEASPSILGTPLTEMFGNDHPGALLMSSNHWLNSGESNLSNLASNSALPRSGHVLKPSISKLNVAAKEFRFDPLGAFNPGQFAFGTGKFQHRNINDAPLSFSGSVSATSPHFNQSSIRSKSKINVAAPAFTPGQSDFSFSSSGPTFRPNAPAFKPSFTESVGSGSDGARSSIFGNIVFSELGTSKSKRNSRAIPIVRPDSSHTRSFENDTMEGKDGRITQGEGRIKRVRGDQDNGDFVSLFAEPNMLLCETSRGQASPKDAQPDSKATDKENTVPETNGRTSQATSPYQTSEKRPLSEDVEWQPFEFQQQKQAEDFNTARPFTSRRYASGLPGYGYQAPHDGTPPRATVSNETAEEETKKGHKKTTSNLSATARPFELKPSPFDFTFGNGPNPRSDAASNLSSKMGGLAESMFARSPSPPPAPRSPEVALEPGEAGTFQQALPQPESPPHYSGEREAGQESELTFEQIDALMGHMNETQLSSAQREEITPGRHQSSPSKQLQLPLPSQSSSIRLPSKDQHPMRSDAPSASPRKYLSLPSDSSQLIFTRASVEDPSVDRTKILKLFPSPIHRLNRAASPPASDWDNDFSESEDTKLQNRGDLFDGHLNDVLGGLMQQRLGPLEKTLETIQLSLEAMNPSGGGYRRERDRRSVSGALSDADDEDEEGQPRRSISPRRDKKLDKIRAVVAEALTAHKSSRPQTATPQIASSSNEALNVLKALEDIKEQFGASMRLDFRAEDLRNVVEEAVEKRMPTATRLPPSAFAHVKEAEYCAQLAEFKEKSRLAKEAIEEEVLKRRDAEDKKAEAEQLLSSSVEEETRLRRLAEDYSSKSEDEISNRRAAEDRLAEVQRLLRIASEEENRLRDAMEKREVRIRQIIDADDIRVRAAEEQKAKANLRISLLEAAQETTSQSQAELANRLNAAENDLLEARKQLSRVQGDADRAMEAARRHSDDAEVANDTNKQLRQTIESLRSQLEESTRVREGMRGRFMDLQEDMAGAAREVNNETANRAKREQELVARQEILHAKLQAEARTRERLEIEIDRLEKGERDGIRALTDCKKFEALVAELRMENHLAQKETLHYQRETEEARESGLSELQRTRSCLEADLAHANNQVIFVRENLEHQILGYRDELEHVKLQADNAKAQHEMLLEEATISRAEVRKETAAKYSAKIEDLQAHNERQLGNANSDARRSEQHLLERLSLSTAKIEHLQERNSHLEERLDIAKLAATAVAQAARTSDGPRTGAAQPGEATLLMPKALPRALELPEKISPQALRESILVLQEQLQDREQNIEKLEQILSTVDSESPTKIAKRDDEITWLRELLSVRKGDLQDVIDTLSRADYDPKAVQDAAIRLRTNLQMEEQERDRAVKGGSAITTLPNIAASLRDAASPKVAQAVGPLTAAWVHWRRGKAGEESNASTPVKAGDSRASPSAQSFLSGLLTPPASTVHTPPKTVGSTRQRFTSAQLANRPRAVGALDSSGRGAGARIEAGEGRTHTGSFKERSQHRPPTEPRTPPMMRKSDYDADAAARRYVSIGDFGSEESFYDDDESAIDGAAFGR